MLLWWNLALTICAQEFQIILTLQTTDLIEITGR